MPPLHDEDQEESLRDTISAAFRAGSDQSTGQEDHSDDRDDAESAAPSTDGAPDTDEPAPTSPDKDVAKAKTAEVGEKPDGPDKESDANETLEPPARWTKKQKEWFNGLDKNFQRQLIDNDKNIQADYTRKMQEIGQERQRYQGLEEVLSPRRETWQRAGMTDQQALQSIMSYWDLANRDPYQFIQVVAQERGIDLAQFYQPTPQDIARYMAEYGDSDELGQASAVPPQLQQRLDQLEYQNNQMSQYIQQIGGTLNQQQTREMQEIQQSANSALSQFQAETDESGNPAHPFLDEVRQDMSALLRAGQANDLKEAYDRAVWGRPDLRERLLESMELRKQREYERARQKEAAQAKRAGSSVAASSSGAASPPASSEDDMSLRDLIKQAWGQAQAGDRI